MFRKPVAPAGPKYGWGLTVREETGAVITLNVDAHTLEEACSIVAHRDGFGDPKYVMGGQRIDRQESMCLLLIA
jgi:hypothetical protein